MKCFISKILNRTHCTKIAGLGLMALSLLCFWLRLSPTAYSEELPLQNYLWSLGLPLSLGLGGALMLEPQPRQTATTKQWPLIITVAIVVCLVLSYTFAFHIFEQMFSVWSRMNYEGNASLSLTTAAMVAAIWSILTTVVVCLYRMTSIGNKPAFFLRTCLSILTTTACVSSLFLIYSHRYIVWRL